MKLSHVFIEEYRSISRQSLDLGGLTVLFGANSSGKTNVLEAVEGILTGVEPRRHAKFGTDFGDEEPATGRYVAELDYLAVPGHPDQRRLLELLGNRDEASYARVLPPPDRQLVEIASFDEARSLLAEALVQSGNCGDEDDRRLIADAMVRSGVIMKDEDLWLVAIGEDLDPAVIEAAERVADALADAGQDTTDDHLAISCAQLTADGFCYVETLGESPGLVRTEWLATDPERVTEEVEQDLGSIEIVPMLTGGGVTDALRAIAGVGTWLETQAPAGNEGPSNMSEAFAGTSRDWMRVRPALHAVADLLSRRATDLLPTFLRDQGRVVCSITPPILWGREPRVQIAFEEHDGTVVPLEVIGAGSRRWAVASVRRAAADLRDARWRLRSSGSVLDDGADSDPLAELVDELRTSNAALSDAEAESQLREISTAAEMLELVEPDWPKRVDDVVLVDEPEANLHPAATESVIDWLRQAGSTYGAVIVATHDRRFLELTPDEADLVYVERRNGKTELRPLGEAGIHALDGVAEEMGLRRADLLQLQRMVLFVEGVHDQAVLEAYVGDVLRRERVLVLPMHGTHNAMALADSEILWELGIPVGVFTDNKLSWKSTDETSRIQALITEARASGREVAHFGIEAQDVLELLDDGVCQAAAPEFPGWAQAAREWKRSSPPMKFKQFVTHSYGLRLDRRSVARLADRTMVEVGPHPEVVREMKRITAYLANRARRSSSPDRKAG